jgi:hypothetical protein
LYKYIKKGNKQRKKSGKSLRNMAKSERSVDEIKEAGKRGRIRKLKH